MDTSGIADDEGMENAVFTYRWMAGGTDGEVLKAKRVTKSSNISWRITVRPGANADVTVVLSVTTRCGARGAICTKDGRKLSNSLNFTVSGPGG